MALLKILYSLLLNLTSCNLKTFFLPHSILIHAYKTIKHLYKAKLFLLNTHKHSNIHRNIHLKRNSIFRLLFLPLLELKLLKLLYLGSIRQILTNF